jgi:hypothetical protein
MEMDCSDCQRLRKEYDWRWEEYFTAMNTLMALRETARKPQYVQLGEACHHARARCEEARLLLETHEATHSQSRSAGQGA